MVRPRKTLSALALLLALALPWANAVAEPPPAEPEADPGLRAAALVFFEALLARDAEVASALCQVPFRLDGQTVPDTRALGRRWEALLARRDLPELTLYGIRFLRLDAMRERYGPPPERLGVDEAEGGWVAIADVEGTPWVAVFRQAGRRWRAVAYTD